MRDMTLVLGAADVVIDLPRLADELAAALQAPAVGTPMRVRAEVTADVTAMVLMPGLAPGIPAYTVKVHAKNPSRAIAITGVICLHDLDGDLLALIDSGPLTALRTGLGGALGAHVLARPDARHVTVIGAGAQGRAQLEALLALRRIESISVRDTNPLAERKFLAWAEELGLRAGRPDGPEIVLMATWSRAPILTEVPPGTHITSLGVDEPDKVELGPELLARSLVVVDDRTLALVRSSATLGEVLRGDHPGRTHEDQVTVYSPVGLPLQDLVIAWHVYQNAR